MTSKKGTTTIRRTASTYRLTQRWWFYGKHHSFGDKEHLNWIDDIIRQLSNHEKQFMTFRCPLIHHNLCPKNLSQGVKLPCRPLIFQYRPLVNCLDCHSFQFGKGHIQQCRVVHSVCSCIERIYILQNSYNVWFSIVRQVKDWFGSWLELIGRFLVSIPFSSFHIIFHPHSHHDLIIYALALTYCCMLCWGKSHRRMFRH